MPPLWRFKALLRFPCFLTLISSHFPMAPCSCALHICVDMMPSSIGSPQGHYFQIFHKLGGFLKVNGGHETRHIKKRGIYDPGPIPSISQSLLFDFLLLFLVTQARCCSYSSVSGKFHPQPWVGPWCLSSATPPHPPPCELFLLNKCRVLLGRSSSR